MNIFKRKQEIKKPIKMGIVNISKECSENKELINKLKDLTINHKLEWKTIPSFSKRDNHLDNYISKNKKELNYNDFENVFILSEIESFYTNFNDGFIYVFKYNNKDLDIWKCILALQKDQTSPVIKQEDYNQVELMKLVYYIEENSVYELKLFIDSIITNL